MKSVALLRGGIDFGGMFGGTPKLAFYVEPYAECLCGHDVNVRSAKDIYRRCFYDLMPLTALLAVGVFRPSS